MANTASLNAIVRSSAVPSATRFTYRARADPNSARHDDHARPWPRLAMAMAGRIDAVPGYPLKTTGLSGKPLGTGTPTGGGVGHLPQATRACAMRLGTVGGVS